jgi:N-acetyl-anhydromuramyl-L-alanine amidase AmpD
MFKRLLLGFLPFVLVLTGGCTAVIEKETVAKAEKEERVAVQKEILIPVIKDFMPRLNFVPQGDVKTHVVLHFTSNAVADPESPYVYEEVMKNFIDYEVSPHYMIDRKGEIYYLLPESRAARHAGKGNLSGYPDYKDHLNRYSIGIELMAIGTEEEMATIMSSEHYKTIPPEHIGYTEAQYKALNLLLGDIVARHKEIKKDRNHIIGHDEYAPDRKTDPGSLFDWSKIMADAKKESS